MNISAGYLSRVVVSTSQRAVHYNVCRRHRWDTVRIALAEAHYCANTGYVSSKFYFV